MKKFSLLLSFVLAAGVAFAAPQGTAAPAKKTAAAKATKTAAAKTHEVSAEFVSFDAAKKTLTVKTDAGEQTSPAQGKALTSAKAFKAGDKVVVTCKDNAAGEHEAAIAIKKAPAAKAPAKS